MSTHSIIRSTVPLAVLAAALSLGPPRQAAEAPAPSPGGSLIPWSRVEVIAGSSENGDGGPALGAKLVGVAGMAIDPKGNLYVADSGSNRIRRIDTETGVITTVAGSGTLDEREASRIAVEHGLGAPGALDIDPTGRYLYIGEVVGRRLLRLDLHLGVIEDLGAPPGGFGKPSGVAWTPEAIWVSDSIRGQVWVLGPNGQWRGVLPDDAKLHGGIRTLARDARGRVHIVEYFGHRVLRLDPEAGTIETIAGTGESGRSPEGAQGVNAALRTPDGIAFDRDGDLLIADMGNRRICRLDSETGALTTLYESAEQGGSGRWTPGALLVDRKGNLWVGDIHRDRVLRFAAGATRPEVVAGEGDVRDGGPATEGRLAHPSAVAADRRGNVYISDTMHHRIRMVDAETGRITTVAGTGIPGYNGDGISGINATLSYPAQIQIDGRDRLYIGDYYNNRVRVLDTRSQRIFTVAGTGEAGEAGDGGPANSAQLTNPHVLYLDGDGTLLVASAVSSSVRSIDLAKGTISTVPLDGVPENRIIHGIGRWKDGLLLVMPRPTPGSIDILREGKRSTLFDGSEIDFPYHIAVSPKGELYVCDTGANRIQRWNGERLETVLEDLGRPRGIAFDADGNLLIADTFYNRVLRVKLHPSRGAMVAQAGRGGAR